MDKRKSVNYLKIGIVLSLCIMVLSSLVFALDILDRYYGYFEEKTNADNENVITVDSKRYAIKENIETFLVIGLDKSSSEMSAESYNNNMQADSLMLFVFDHENKKCNIIQINRDTMTKVNVLGVAGGVVDTSVKQIALSHTYGNGKEVSCRNVVDSVSSLLNVKINHYMSVKMDAVPVVNDIVGGVTVKVVDDFGGFDETLVKGETVLLKGEHALNYVRGRQNVSDNTNINRMARQRQYIKALHEKTLKCISENESLLEENSTKFMKYIISDCSVNDLQAIFNRVSNYKVEEVHVLKGEEKLGTEYIEFYPNKKEIQNMILELFYVLEK